MIREEKVKAGGSALGVVEHFNSSGLGMAVLAVKWANVFTLVDVDSGLKTCEGKTTGWSFVYTGVNRRVK